MQGKKRPEYPQKPPRVPDTSPERLKAIVERHRAEKTYYTVPHDEVQDLLCMLRGAVAVILAVDQGYQIQFGVEGYREMLGELEGLGNAGSDGGSSGEAG